ncbi:MAG TPA: chemotaxis protein CheX [Spirochaetota bacterium]|nr:chemotaxis protein CheX [Spirochaetota bacterium]HOM37866.1 chemotaxis protein CheX [Spirochaetota bacterium]HPQ48670.1 chemotaxis protein CheX [Spirochaetota bacterium]
MRIDFIDPFLEATEEIIREVLNVEPKRGEMELNEQETIPDIGVFLGLTGQASGRMLINFDKNLALKIIEVMNGEPHALESEMGQATIGELGNMITGRAVTKLYEKGFHFNLTPPSVIVGNNVRVSTLGIETLSVPYHISYGNLEINISIKENV